MSKIRVLSDHVANQIAAGEVVERPASVAKELVENSIDAGGRRIEVDVEAGGRRLLRVSDDGEGMTRDDALLAFERHATSKLYTAEDLNDIRTLGFRGEALPSIASIARVELITQTEGADAATRVQIEGGRMRDVAPAARARGTTISVRDLFFNVPARRKFLRSEATESFHLTNLLTHYALAHPEIAFLLTNNGRETLRASAAADLRERAYQIFGAEFLDNLLEVSVEQEHLARVRGYVSSPRERRTTRDAQYLFVNGRFVRDRLISRALSEAYRSILPPGAYPAAILFLEVPHAEVDVNVHPAKTEVRFRRAPAIADVVREAVRAALAGSGFLRRSTVADEASPPVAAVEENEFFDDARRTLEANTYASALNSFSQKVDAIRRGEGEQSTQRTPVEEPPPPTQATIEFASAAIEEARKVRVEPPAPPVPATPLDPARDAYERSIRLAEAEETSATPTDERVAEEAAASGQESRAGRSLPPLVSAAGLVREVPLDRVAGGIRPLGQMADSYIVATDDEGLLLIDQHVAHERILFDKYRALEETRRAESQHLLMPETIDLAPAQAVAFDAVADELETYGFAVMRLSGRTVALRAVPADLPAGEAQQMLAELLNTVNAERHKLARELLRERIAAALACRAAVKAGTTLSAEKMRWLIERLLDTSSPTTNPHGRPVMLRLSMRDIEKGFHRG